MALAQLIIQRTCPPEALPELEKTISDIVNSSVYSEEGHQVTTYSLYGTMRRRENGILIQTHLEVGVELDTEDLPANGWYPTKSGILIPPNLLDENTEFRNDSFRYLKTLKNLPDLALTTRHEMGLVRAVKTSILKKAMWNKELFGWTDQKDLPVTKLGVLVKAGGNGAWTDSGMENI